MSIVRIPLTKGYTAVVDEEDYPLVLPYSWYAYEGHNGIVYAVTTTSRRVRKTALRMHRLILSAPDDLEVDHIDRNGLNNRRSNLRFATQSQNSANCALYSTNTSGYKGVSWHIKSGKWRATFGNKHLGLFESAEEAADAYDSAIVKTAGEFARTNAFLKGKSIHV